MAEPVPMTPRGAQKLRDDLARLKEERPKISREIGVAREHGDLKENAEYHAAKDRQGMVEAQIKDIEDKLARAEIIDPTKLSGDRVRFGAFVKVTNLDTDEELTYQIVGADEADINSGMISVSLRRSRGP
jgi:transcription elongation factor GreA